jgi:D-apiose dehydrogenase
MFRALHQHTALKKEIGYSPTSADVLKGSANPLDDHAKGRHWRLAALRELHPMPITKLAIAGLGAAARNIHIPAIKRLDQVELVGTYDVTAEAAIPGVQRYASIDAMLSEAQPDMLIVATPPQSHLGLVRQGLAHGVHVFCEKPLANSLEEADAMIALAAAANREVIVNSEFPFMAIHRAAKAALDDPGVGRLMFLEMRQSFVTTNETEAGWRGADLQRTFKEFGTHVIDLATFFFGEPPETVRALMPRPAGPATPDLLNLVELTFSGGRVAHIVLNRFARGQHRYLDIALNGEHATIETSIGGRLSASAGLRTATRRPFLEVDFALGGRAREYRGERFKTLATSPLDLFAEGTAALLGDVIAALAAGREPPNNLAAARRTLAAVYAAYDSAVDGQPRQLA